MSSPWYVKGIHQITEVTKKVPDSGFDQERLDHPVSPPIPTIVAPSSPCHPGSSILIDDSHEGLLTEEQARRGTGKELTKGDRSQMTIDVLPDVALLRIFDFCMDRSIRGREQPAWHRLVHVCRNWRNVIFGSPRRLELLLYCRASTPVRQMLDIWPQLPIAIQASCYDGSPWNEDNIFAALKHNNRISEMYIFDTPTEEGETLLAALQQPFPALTTLVLEFYTNETLVVPASFLGGSAPDLRTLNLDLIPFPGLPNLLLTATHLVHLQLHDIPHSGYFSSEAMVTALAVLTSLKTLHIEFQYECPRSLPDRRLDPRTRVLLPALTELQLKGIREYPEDFVARIDAPLLDRLIITVFFHYQLIYDSPQLIQFMSRTPKFKVLNEALVVFFSYDVSLTLLHASDAMLEMRIPCNQFDAQLSCLAQVCSSSIRQAFMSAIERLRIENGYIWQGGHENSRWLELFRPFTAVKDLYIASGFTSYIGLALQELVGERVKEVLPALQTLFLEVPLQSGPLQEAIGQFVAARRLAGHPVAVSRWEREKGSVAST